MTTRKCAGCGVDVPNEDATTLEARTSVGTAIRVIACPTCASAVKEGKHPRVSMGADGKLEAIPSVPAKANTCSPVQRDRERILCAAVHFDDGKVRVHQPRNIATGIVICGRRHHNCFATAGEQGWCDPTQYWRDSGGKCPRSVQGFLTSADRFVDRAEAAQIAREAGQVERSRVEEDDELISEDLY